MSKKKVIISACLLGEVCRYDAKIKQSNEVIDAFRDYEIIPFCPEAPLFGTPRGRISVVDVDGERKIITDETNKDVTKLLEDEIYSFIDKNPQTDAIVLKSKSPSCGYKTTPILDKDKNISTYGNEIAVDIFLKKYPDVKILDESRFL
ncbi:MAG: DUF523 domain-containing protein [Campylobacterales bacterium]|nr:DUF523 domain-containing protein [Campylobacterales bacterium]